MTKAPKGKSLLVKAVLVLLAMGVLSYGYLPEAYCPLEDMTVRYIYMSDSHKTVTKVLPSVGDEGLTIKDDRCQKGTQIGEWIPVNSNTMKDRIELKVLAYTDNGKYVCNGMGQDAICISENDLSQTELSMLGW